MILRKDTYPRAILHIDGDAFFAACEVARNPSLRGKPVIVGLERSIASAMTYEAKACGVTRAMNLSEIKRVCPQAILVNSNYEMYELYSRRMYEIVRRYTSDVEEYSIDECFADITGLQRPLEMTYEEIAGAIKKDLQNELGLTFSIGLSVNKILAKIGSKHSKPNGLVFMPGNEIHLFLAKTKIEKIWGVGPNTAAVLQRLGVITALDLALKSRAWVAVNFTKPVQEIHGELLGDFIMPLGVIKGKHNKSSISRTQTFTPPSKDKNRLWSELSKNIENACDTLRQQQIFARKVSVFLKTQDFKYFKMDLSLSSPTCFPQDILSALKKHFDQLFKPGVLYRATGIDLHDLSEQKTSTRELCKNNSKDDKLEKVYTEIDKITNKFGHQSLILASSLKKKQDVQKYSKDSYAQKNHVPLNTTDYSYLNLPFLGKVN
ncbi:MAG: DNA polymerase IV [bacterium]